jgi:hypothetical protein
LPVGEAGQRAALLLHNVLVAVPVDHPDHQLHIVWLSSYVTFNILSSMPHLVSVRSKDCLLIYLKPVPSSCVVAFTLSYIFI